MQILSLNFSLYSIAGIWRPLGWSSSAAKILYNVFTVCTIVPLYFLMLTQFLDIVFIVDNMDDFTTNSLIFMTVVAVCCKATVAVLRRNAIINLIQILASEPCKPRDEEEIAIQSRFDEFIRSFSIKYSLLVTISATGVTIKSVLSVMQGMLPYRVWLPYNSTVPMLFWITSIMQIVALIFAAIINMSTETLMFGLFLQTCSQLEIFEKRLDRLVICKTSSKLINGPLVNGLKRFPPTSTNKEETVMSKCIQHHLSIYKYARTVNKIFSQILFVQFFSSILILCTCVYYLSSHIMQSESATLIVYTFGMFVQIYVYCWLGNEVILKSANVGDAVYRMNWPSLAISEKKELLMIMRRSTIPIKFTSSFLITLSLQSYGSILKTSYSAFNVLQQ